MHKNAVVVEPARETEIVRDCDVLVVGGGPGGCAAAASAAALGARTILVERYGYLGGMSTGGFVLWIDRMTDWEGRQVVGGLADDLLGRLPPDAILGPPQSLWGSHEEHSVSYWQARHSASRGVVTWSPTIDPEWLKIASFQLLKERGVELLLHSWAVAAVVENGRVRGAILESKAGRTAIAAGMVVDATGDGDIFNSAGAASDIDIAEGTWHHTINLGFRWGGVDTDRFAQLLESGEIKEIMSKGAESGAEPVPPDLPYLFPRPGVVFFMAPKLVGFECLSVEDLTAVEWESRRLMLLMLDFYRRNVPGFEKAWVLDTAPQMGVRHSRRLQGVKKVTREQWVEGMLHDDEIGICPPPSPGVSSISIPLGSLVPADLEGLLVAGRNLSCDALSHVHVREIPICWVTGQAAGTTAAVALATGIQPRDVTAGDVQRALLRQGAILRTAGNG